MNWYLEPLRKYADFTGRARRKEFWMFSLFNALITGALAIAAIGIAVSFEGVLRYSAIVLYLIYCIGATIPHLAVTVRRLHDTGRSGWWYFIGMVPLVGILLLVYLCEDSQPGENMYGPNPKMYSM